MKYCTLLILILITFGCSDRGSDFLIPKIVDNTKDTNGIFTYSDNKCYGIYPIVGYYQLDSYINTTNSKEIEFISSKITKKDSSKLIVYVDTTQIINTDLYRKYYKNEINEGLLFVASIVDCGKENSKYRKYYNTLIINPSENSEIIDEFNNSLLIIQLALNEENNWQEIERYYSGYCSNAKQHIKIAKQHALLTQTKIFIGEFKTKMKLAVWTPNGYVFSNIFEGSINTGQFERKQ